MKPCTTIHRPRTENIRCAAGAAILGGLLLGSSASADVGRFTGQTDVGTPAHPGSAEFDAGTTTYRITGGGENMWGATDAFHYVWTQVSGDIALAADVAFPDPGGHPHRKACLIIRQTLDANAVYVDAALHGDGLTSLQFRTEPGAGTHEVQTHLASPTRLRIEKSGNRISLSAAAGDGPLSPTGCSIELPFADPFYIGLGVCAHDDTTHTTAQFANLELSPPPPPVAGSSLETLAIASGDRRCLYYAPDRFEAPNWTPDGTALIFNRKGRLYSLALADPSLPHLIDTGFAVACNNDHGISPDGRLLAISDQTREGQSIIYTLPIEGGTPRQVTPRGPSYWHGWSPDGDTLAYCAERNSAFDIYTIPVDGGEETRLTADAGHNDGPDYSPDGRFIYFNSNRTGPMQIWRMHPDGSAQEPVTNDDYNNWFPHPSPDGNWIVFLSYEPGVTGHPADQPVQLRLLPTAGGPIRVLARFTGGQGTINVPSWSPDSQHIAYVTYQTGP